MSVIGRFTPALLAVAALFGLLSAATPSSAETMTWHLQSNYPYRVQAEFYSQIRNWAWPGGGQAYNLNDSAVHDFPLTCNSGEKICVGAWSTGNASIYWGVGYDNRHGCTSCCYICGGGELPTITLN
jgi:hypothetical protein